jgi:hypothetical protein
MKNDKIECFGTRIAPYINKEEVRRRDELTLRIDDLIKQKEYCENYLEKVYYQRKARMILQMQQNRDSQQEPHQSDEEEYFLKRKPNKRPCCQTQKIYESRFIPKAVQLQSSKQVQNKFDNLQQRMICEVYSSRLVDNSFYLRRFKDQNQLMQHQIQMQILTDKLPASLVNVFVYMKSRVY